MIIQIRFYILLVLILMISGLNIKTNANCSITIQDLTTVFGVASTNNTYSLVGNLDISNPPVSGTLAVRVQGGASQFFEAPFSSLQSFIIQGLYADGVDRTVEAVFSADTGCNDTAINATPNTSISNPKLALGYIPPNMNLTDINGRVLEMGIPDLGLEAFDVGAFDINISDQDMSDYAAFCMDLNDFVPPGVAYNNEFVVVELEKAMSINAGVGAGINVPTGGIGRVKAGQIRWVFDNYYNGIHYSLDFSEDEAAAFQVVLWDIIHDHYDGTNYDVEDGTLNENFYVTTDPSDARNAAQSILNEINNLGWSNNRWESYYSIKWHPRFLESDGQVEVDFGDGPETYDIQDIIVAVPLESDVTTEIVTVGECWRTLSSPVEDITYAQLLDDFWTQGVTGAKNDQTGTPNVYTLNSGGTDWVAIPDLTVTIEPGTGFLISIYDQDGSGTIPDPAWPKILSVSGTEPTSPVEVSGLPPNSSTNDGFAILGNPFQSPIELDELNLVGVYSAFYVYDRNTGGPTIASDGVSQIQGGWRSYGVDATGVSVGDITDGIIRPFQGFVVQTSTDNGTRSVTFPETAKTTGGMFYGKRRTLQNYIRFEVGNENLYNSMWVRFSDIGSNNHVSGDALEMSPMTEDYILLGTRKKNGTLFDIGHFQIPDTYMEIPVGFEATMPGMYVIRVTDFDMSSGHTLYFNDLQTGKSLFIDESFYYEFTNDSASKPNMAPIACGDIHPRMAKTLSMDDRFFITTSPMDLQTEFPVELPEKVLMAQNFPNPFNPSTVIRFEIPEAGHVRLAVYDMLGRQIDVLVNENRTPGMYEVTWDAERASSGTYLYRLEANGVVINHTMTLLK